MKKITISAALVPVVVAGSSFLFPDPPAGLLKLPGNFRAEIIADNLGAARHLAVSKQGLVYVKLAKLKEGKGIIVLGAVNSDGRPAKETGFGNFIGTGMYIKDDYLYASSNTDVYRYRLNDRGAKSSIQRLLSGLLPVCWTATNIIPNRSYLTTMEISMST
jgi:hypothetical protein